MSESQIQTVECYKTSDGRLFENHRSAEHHQEDIDAQDAANKRLDAGGSIAECLRVAGFKADVDPILERITKHTQLVISHWQCKDVPGYQPRHFDIGLNIFCYGNAGSWSGHYGNTISISELVRYAQHNKTIFDCRDKEQP